MRRRYRKQRGYVLVLTLVMLALATVALQAMVLRSMESALASTDASDALQRRWAMASLQQVLLPRIPAFLQQAERKAQAAVPSLHASIALGGQSFDLTLADEQAKLNVNLLYDRLGQDGLEAAYAQTTAELPDAPAMELRPLRPSDPDQLDTVRIKQLLADLAPAGESPTTQPAATQPPRKPPAFISFHQVFPSASPEVLLRGEDPWTRSWTCWGNGRITLRRASPQTITQACQRVLNQLEIRKLLEARSQVWNAPVIEILSQLDLVEVKRARLEELFTGRSECYSLWIVQQSGQRSWYRFAVRDATQKPNSRVAVFEW